MFFKLKKPLIILIYFSYSQTNKFPNCKSTISIIRRRRCWQKLEDNYWKFRWKWGCSTTASSKTQRRSQAIPNDETSKTDSKYITIMDINEHVSSFNWTSYKASQKIYKMGKNITAYFLLIDQILFWFLRLDLKLYLVIEK